jgi:hypothetical protein
MDVRHDGDLVQDTLTPEIGLFVFGQLSVKIVCSLVVLGRPVQIRGEVWPRGQYPMT